MIEYMFHLPFWVGLLLYMNFSSSIHLPLSFKILQSNKIQLCARFHYIVIRCWKSELLPFLGIRIEQKQMNEFLCSTTQSCGNTPRGGIAESYDRFIYSFLKNLYTNFHSIEYSAPVCTPTCSDQSSPNPTASQNLLSLVFYNNHSNQDKKESKSSYNLHFPDD